MKIFLLRIMEFKIDRKLSSNKIISEESLAISVLLIPIDTPISAYFKAGTSLLPSAVTRKNFFKY